MSVAAPLYEAALTCAGFLAPTTRRCPSLMSRADQTGPPSADSLATERGAA